ncbi:MAG: hypothetical protein D6720_07390 [Gammaproteobacteria bacterium]|nr:MAG: hypothetical protein D6720_07390 [Gammaproteobacteria bacterium]
MISMIRMASIATVSLVLSGCLTTPRYSADPNTGLDTGGAVFSRVNYHLDPTAELTQPKCLALLPLALSKEAAEPLSLDLMKPSAKNTEDAPIEIPADDSTADDTKPQAPDNPTPYRHTFDASAKRRLVRETLYGFISAHSPRDLELARVDRVTGGFPVTNPARYRLVARELGCDWLLTGRITTFDVDYFGIYSNIRIGAELKLVQASTGRIIWRGSHTAQSREGAVPLSPIDLAVGAVKAADNLSPDQLEAVAADLARRLVRTMPLDPDNPFLVAARRSRFYQVVARALNLRQGPGTRYAVRRVLRGAEQVSILEATKGGAWCRVQTRDGTVGYAARRFLRPVIENAQDERKHPKRTG